jgi:hypothetical protein
MRAAFFLPTGLCLGAGFLLAPFFARLVTFWDEAFLRTLFRFGAAFRARVGRDFFFAGMGSCIMETAPKKGLSFHLREREIFSSTVISPIEF